MAKGNHGTTVTPEEFVRTWQTSKSVQDVAEKLGCTANSAYQRAFNFRKKGVPLKSFGGYAQRQYDWDGLKKLAKSLEK